MARIDSFQDLGCLVTGASSGIGREIAYRLADAGARLVLTARRADRLAEVAAACRDRGAPRVEVLVADLAGRDAVERVAAAAEAALGHVDVLVNNAGFSVPGPFVRSDLARTLGMLEVNVVAATGLMRRLLPGMVARRRGGVLNVASMAGIQPAPFQAAYAGTKAYLLNLSASVHPEARRSGVVVTALCPGVTDTEFFEAAGYRDLGRFLRWRMDAGRVAKAGLAALRRGRVAVVPGTRNRALLLVARFVPRAVTVRVASWLMSARR